MSGRQLTNWEATRLVTGRELKVKIRDKTFLISTGFLLLFAILGTVVPSLIGGGTTSVAVVAGTPTEQLTAVGLEVREVADAAEAERLVRDGDVDSAVLDGVVLALDDAPDEVVSALSSAPQVRLLDPGAVNEALGFLVPYLFAMVFFFTSLMFGLQIAQSVTEEKQTRIVEILVAGVPVRALLAGKVIALTLLAFGQILLIAVAAVVGARVADVDTSVLRAIEPAVGWFLPFFLVGFVMLATVWAGVGALVNRQEDLTGASMPVLLAVMVPFFAVVSFNTNPAVMTVLSYVPFSAPIAMPVRLFTGDAAWWEPYASLGLLAVTTAVLLAVGTRIYESSLLRTNGRTSLVAAWKGWAGAR